jgi:hypothetical protein
MRSFMIYTPREHDLDDQIKKNDVLGFVAHMEEVHTGFRGGKPTGKTPRGKPRCSWQDNTK